MQYETTQPSQNPDGFTDPSLREAVGVFNDPEQLDAAVRELERTSFPRHDISVKSADDGMTARNAEDSSRAERAILVRPEEKTIAGSYLVGVVTYVGAITVGLVAGAQSNGDIAGSELVLRMLMGAAAGAIIGTILLNVFDYYMKREWKKQMSSGGAVLWVRTPAPDREQLALQIMRRYGARDVHTHSAFSETVQTN